MNVEEFREHCISKKEVTEEFPFNESTLVFKVRGKIFALADIEDFTSINLKNDPEENERLRDRHPEIIPGYHMNKRHWNTVLLEGSLSDKFIFQLIDQSYNLVVAGLPKKEQQKLRDL